MSIKRIFSVFLAALVLFGGIPTTTAFAAPLTSVTVNSPGVSYLTVGATQTFTATMSPANPDDLVWSVCEEDGISPTGKASITQSGVVTAISTGYITVVASNPGGSVRSSYPIFILDSTKQYNILSKSGGNALTANSAGTAVTLSSFTNSNTQKWEFELPSGNAVKIKSVSAGNFVTVPTSGSTVSLATAPVSDDTNQRFTMNGVISYTDSANWANRGCSTELGSFKLVSALRTDQVLNVSGTTLNIAGLATENAWNEVTLAQKFRIVPAFGFALVPPMPNKAVVNIRAAASAQDTNLIRAFVFLFTPIYLLCRLKRLFLLCQNVRCNAGLRA